MTARYYTNRWGIEEKFSQEDKSPKYVWELTVHSETHLNEWVMDYFDGIDLSNEIDGTSVITGLLPDMPAVYGLIMKLRDSGICVISLKAERKNV